MHFDAILLPNMGPHTFSPSVYKKYGRDPSLCSIDFPIISFIDYVPMRLVSEDKGVEVWQQADDWAVNFCFLELRQV